MNARSCLLSWLAFTALYLGAFGTLATWKKMWSDEILTYHLARLPDVPTLWAALSDGPDASGPLHFLTVMASYRCLGPTPLATRLPAILGVLVMSLSLFRFAARRVPAELAWLAVLFPLATEAYLYVIEGRSYGILLGFTGLALLAYQGATDGDVGHGGRLFWRCVLWLALAAAVSSQYYAILIFIPFGLAEVARTLQRRRIDVATGLAIVAGLAPLAFFGPLLKNAGSYSVYLHAPIRWMTFVDFYEWLLTDTWPPLVASLVLVPLAFSVWPRTAGEEPDEAPLQLHEVVAAGAFALLPLFMLIVARLIKGNVMNRYCLPSIAGFGLLIPLLASRLRGRRLAGAVMSTVFLAWFVANYGARVAMSGAYSGLEQRADLYQIPTDEGLPVATYDYHMFIEAHYYLDRVKNANLVYLTGLKDTIQEREVKELEPWVGRDKPLNVKDYDEFLAAHDRFLVMGNPALADSLDLLLGRLRRDGATVKLRGERGVCQVYEVSRASRRAD